MTPHSCLPSVPHCTGTTMSSSTPYTRKRTLSMSIGLSTRRAKRTRVDGPAPIPFHGVSLSTGPVPTALDMGPPALAPVFSLRRAASHTDFTLEKIITSYPPGSTHHILRDHGISIDFTPSGGSSGSQAMVPLSYSARHTLFFGHGNDVYARNMLAPVADDGAPFCTVDGPLTLLEAGGVDCSGLLAVGTSRGAVQIRDAQTRGMVSTYTVKGATAVAWSGRTLTVATAQGTVRQIDTREPQKKKRGGAGRKTAHEAAITALAWNPGHSLYVTGDADGTVLCWDPRARTALNVEEPIAHAAAISVRLLTNLTHQPIHSRAATVFDVVSLEPQDVRNRRRPRHGPLLVRRQFDSDAPGHARAGVPDRGAVLLGRVPRGPVRYWAQYHLRETRATARFTFLDPLGQGQPDPRALLPLAAAHRNRWGVGQTDLRQHTQHRRTRPQHTARRRGCAGRAQAQGL
ncbi:unnamed protein product [Mycena citricolor]|uniref:WD40 repeat-like protein n=1 Tax=Mycena citricolor TaxID=2018698 RepID=A0AAD2HAJ7_9AGAR|nr:unnamed protein product [Mycena citricolor]